MNTERLNNEEFKGKINGKGSNLQIPNDYYLIPDFPFVMLLILAVQTSTSVKIYCSFLKDEYTGFAIFIFLSS